VFVAKWPRARPVKSVKSPRAPKVSIELPPSSVDHETVPVGRVTGQIASGFSTDTNQLAILEKMVSRRLPVKFARSLVLSVALAAGAVACSKDPVGPGGQATGALTALPRSLTTAENKVITASNAFAFSLFSRVAAAQRDSNVFISPMSASFALGMTLNGAANQTFDEMRAALQFGGATPQEINDGYKSLLALLASLDPAVKMQVANSIWYQGTFPFNQSFLDAGRTYFDAEIRGLDFANVSASLAAINGWVNTKTNGKIPSILDSIDSDLVMFLINAIYFNGNWRTKFDASLTTDAQFQPSTGAAQAVKLMHRNGKMLYTETAAYQAVDLPYGDSAYTMTVVLPKSGQSVETVASSLTSASWQSLISSLQVTAVDLFLPKLKLSYERQLKADLEALGMRIPFVPDRADFTNMSTSRGRELYIKFVKQKTFVDVNEEGTEAAAVTGVGIGVTSAPLTVNMRVDRPYVFVLRERLTGTLLFMGKIVRMP
jgi:serpin B